MRAEERKILSLPLRLTKRTPGGDPIPEVGVFGARRMSQGLIGQEVVASGRGGGDNPMQRSWRHPPMMDCQESPSRQPSTRRVPPPLASRLVQSGADLWDGA